jgi:hypothetical protein
MGRKIFIVTLVALLMFSAVAMLSISVSGKGSAKAQDKSERSGEQQIICERTYINFAFGRVHRGIYVDREGNVYSYAYQRRDQPWRSGKDGTYTEEELLEKYDHDKKLIANVNLKEVAAKRELTLKASTGAYSKRIRRGADQGTYTSTCYLHDAATAKYRGITLKKSGDENYENLSEEAKTLSAWLDSLAPKRAKH